LSLPAVIASNFWQTKAIKGFCDFYSRHKAVTVEVLSINTPRTLIVRNRNEMVDTAFNEYMNSVGYFGGLKLLGLGLNRFLKRVFPSVAKRPSVNRFAKTAFLVPAFMGYMVAMPFYRNAFTAWRSKTLDFRDLITQEQHHNPAHWREFADKNRHKGHWSLLAGLVVGTLGLAFAVKRPQHILRWSRQAASRKTFDFLTLAGKTGDRLKNDFQAIMYWGAPTYLAWMASSRDKFEFKEQALRFANFMVMFSLPGKLINGLFKEAFKPWQKQFPALFKAGQFDKSRLQTAQKGVSALRKKALQRAADSLEKLNNKRTIYGFLLTTILMSVSPAVINIFLTNQRLKATLEKEREKLAWASYDQMERKRALASV
jgi:hypothetical protein